MTRSDIEATALKLLLSQPLHGEYALHFFDYRHLLLHGKAQIDTFASYEKRSGIPLPRGVEGLTLKTAAITLILYNDTIPSQSRIAFTIAHELGHLFLAHEEGSPRTEREADAFAASLLMPEAVIRFLDCQKGRPLTPREMTTYFSASLSACQRRRRNLPPDCRYTPSADACELTRRLFGGD